LEGSSTFFSIADSYGFLASLDVFFASFPETLVESLPPETPTGLIEVDLKALALTFDFCTP